MADQGEMGRGQPAPYGKKRKTRGAAALPPAEVKSGAGEPALKKLLDNPIYGTVSGLFGALAMALLAILGKPAIAMAIFFATAGVLTFWLWATGKMSGREARFLWAGLGLLALVYVLLLAFPMQVNSRVVNSKLTPIADYPLKLVDSNFVSHEDRTGPNGEFFVQSVPAGKFRISSQDRILAMGSARYWPERVAEFNVVDVGDLVVDENGQPPPVITISITPTSSPTASLTPAPTLTPTVTPTPTSSPMPTQPPVWTTSLKDGQKIAQTETFWVKYNGPLDGFLWVFVMNQDNHRYYTQSLNPCAGQSVFQKGSAWEIRAGFGTPGNTSLGKKFDVVVAVAKTDLDNQYVAGKLISWCHANNYAGFEVLPDGVTEVFHVRDLVRTEQTFGPAPDITNARVSGQVKITSMHDGDQAPEETSLSGTYSDLAPGSEIWTMVFPGYGIWFPQSRQGADSCTASQVTLDTDHQTWETAVRFGNDSSRTFDVVTVLATNKASDFLWAYQQIWCRAGNYFGFRTIELPQGLEVKDRIRVTRP